MSKEIFNIFRMRWNNAAELTFETDNGFWQLCSALAQSTCAMPTMMWCKGTAQWWARDNHILLYLFHSEPLPGAADHPAIA